METTGTISMHFFRQASAHKLHWTQSETWNSKYALPSSGCRSTALRSATVGQNMTHIPQPEHFSTSMAMSPKMRVNISSTTGSSGSPMRLMASRMAMLRSASMVGILPAPFFTPSFSRSDCSCFCK